MGEFDQSIGFILMGVILNTYLTGFIMSQFFTYWSGINTAQAGVVVYMSWNFANPQVVASLSKTMAIRLIHTQPHTVTAILAITNQMLQSWRIYLFTRNKILIGSLVATSAAACGTGLAPAIEAWIFSESAKLVSLQAIVEVNNALQCAIDVIIAAVFALGILFSFRFSADRHMVSLFSLPIGRIYTHTIMDHFVSREKLQDALSNSGDITVPIFDATGEGFSGASNGAVILLRNVSTRTNTTKINDTV
ncbi:hypothetical protein B0H14DRAFT_2574774 [Mycena olivaceomarginata]|nr:hypothetical protein B0H14DRAFT_2574774 [Mycena olivaceomarginata]